MTTLIARVRLVATFLLVYLAVLWALVAKAVMS
jgi:hypothetical protein